MFKRSALYLTSFCRTRDMNISTSCDTRTCGNVNSCANCFCLVRRFAEWENMHAPCALFRVLHVGRPSTPRASLYPDVCCLILAAEYATTVALRPHVGHHEHAAA